MSNRCILIAVLFAAAAVFARPARSQENAPAEQPAAEEPAKSAEPAKPAEQAKPAKHAEAKAAPAPAKELTPCAKSLVPLADSYKKAYEEMTKWIGDVDAKTLEVSGRIAKTQEQIQQNEAAITKAKLDGDDAKGRDLGRDNKQLWNDLTAARKEKSALCSGFAREAAQKVKEFSTDAAEKLQQAKSSMK